MMTEREAMIEAGGSPWQKPGGEERIYFNGLAGWLGLETWRYNSGNVSSATLNGEPISNSKARAMLDRLYDAKVWWTDGQFHGRGLSDGDLTAIAAAIKARLAEVMAVTA